MLPFYREYEPKTFSDCVGLEHVRDEKSGADVNLKQWAQTADLGGKCLLFSSPTSAGKSLMAKLLAKKWVGEKVDTYNAPGMTQGEFEALVRRLKGEELFHGKAAIIIEEVQSLLEGDKSARQALAHALLHISADTLIIATTPKPLSGPDCPFERSFMERFTAFTLPPHTVEEILTMLRRVCKSEVLDVSQEMLTKIAENAKGCIWDALNALEMVPYFSEQQPKPTAGPKKNSK